MMPKIEKVYCGNCRFYCYDGDVDWCFVEMKDTYYAPRMEESMEPSIRNAHNSCRLYERKWWKFWV